MSDAYVRMYDAAGSTELATFTEFIRLEWSRKENEVGTLTLDLPPNYPMDIFKEDNRFELWRILNSRAYLEGETVYFLRDVQRSTIKGEKKIHLEAYDANYLLGYNGTGRVVPYNDLAYVEKVGTCDDLMKAIVRENMGSLALDTTRNLSPYLTVQANLSLAASSHKAFSGRDLLGIFRELATESFQRGIYLVFDTVYTGTSTLEFRTYVNMRGNDHRRSSPSPVIINLESKSLEDPVLDLNYVDEVTYAYAAGPGSADLRPIYGLADTARLGKSIFNRREQWVDASQTLDADQLETEARTALHNGRSKTVLIGRIVDTDDLIYGLHYGFGDVVVAEYEGYSFDAHVNIVHGIIEKGLQIIDSSIRGEL